MNARRTVPTPLLTKLSDVAAEDISWIWPRRLARGKFTLAAGDPGLGKSRLTFDIAARITTGAPWPDGGGHAPRGSVLMLLAEDGLGDTVRPGITAMGGDAAAVFALDVNTGTDTPRSVNLATDLAIIEQALDDLGPQLVVIDPISAFLGRTDSYKDAEVRGMLAPLLKLVERHRAALLAVAHLSKDSQRTALHRPGGSVAFVAAARLVFCLAADPNDADRRVLAPLKANICKPAPSLAFRLPDGRVEWETGAVSLSAETLLAPPMPSRDHHARDEAELFLQRLLANGPVESARVLREAQAIGITRNTLHRAKATIGVEVRKRGLRDGWAWSLAEGTRVVSFPQVIGPFEDAYQRVETFEHSEGTEETHVQEKTAKMPHWAEDDDEARVQ